jgi:hypothetical protein
MARKLASSDQKPGRLPKIESVDDSITFVMAVDEIQPGAQLKLRCDARGNVWVSTTPAVELGS